MVTYRGYKTYVQYDEETSYGAGATPATTIKGRIQQITINKVNNLIRTVGLGEGRNETFVGWGNFEGTWSMEYLPADFDFLQFGIGAKAGSGTAVLPYYLEEKDLVDYTSGASNGLKSFGLEVQGDGSTKNTDTLSGCIINTISFVLNVGAALQCNLDGFYRTVLSSTGGTTFTADTTKPWIFSQGTFKWNNAAVARVTSATITIALNYDADVGRELGSRFTQAGEPGLRKYDWTITVKMTDAIATTLRDHFYGDTINHTPNSGATDAEPTFYALALELSEGALATHRNARILLENCSINDISKPISVGDNIVELTINGAGKAGKEDTAKKKPITWWTVPT